MAAHSAPASHRRPRSALFALFAALLLLLSACKIRMDVGVDVNEDGSGSLSVTQAFDEEFREMMEENSGEPVDFTDPETLKEMGLGIAAEDLPAGVNAEVRPYKDGEFEGYTLALLFSSFEELETLAAEMRGEDNSDALPVALDVTREGNRFEFRAAEPFSLEEESTSEEGSEDFGLSGLADILEVRLLVKLPGEVVDHNASEVAADGTLIWVSADADEAVVPFAVSEVGGGANWVMVAALVGVVLAGGAGFWWWRRSYYWDDEDYYEDDEEDGGFEPPYPGYTPGPYDPAQGPSNGW